MDVRVRRGGALLLEGEQLARRAQDIEHLLAHLGKLALVGRIAQRRLDHGQLRLVVFHERRELGNALLGHGEGEQVE